MLTSIYGVVLVAFLCYMIIGYLFTIGLSLISVINSLVFIYTGLIFGSVGDIWDILIIGLVINPYIIFIISELLLNCHQINDQGISFCFSGNSK